MRKGNKNTLVLGKSARLEMGKKQTEADEGNPLYSKGSPSNAGITVLRRASTKPNGEPKRKKPETLKSRRAALVGPSGASELAEGGHEAVLARRGSPDELVVEATCRLWGKENLVLLLLKSSLCSGQGFCGKVVTCSESYQAQDQPCHWRYAE